MDYFDLNCKNQLEIYSKNYNNPESTAETYFFIAILCHNNLSMYQRAEDNYLLAIKYKPNFPQAYLQLGQIYQYEFKEYEKSEEYYLQALQQKQDYSVAYFNLGYLYHHRLEQYEKAEQYYLQAIEHKPDYSEAHNNLGILYKDKLDQPQKAEKCYQEAIKFDDKNASAYFNLAKLQTKYLNDYKKAEQNYLQAIKHKENYANAFYNLANLYWEKLDDPVKAEQNYLQAIKHKNDFSVAYNNLGLLYEDSLDQPQKAEKNYLLSIKQINNHASAYKNLANLYFFTFKYYEKAIFNYQHLIRLNPEKYKVQCNEKIKEIEEDIQLYKKSINSFFKPLNYLEENFKEIEQIGQGLYSKVIKVQDQQSNKLQAIKIIFYQEEIDIFLQNMYKMIQLQTRFDSQSIVNIHSIIKQENKEKKLHIVMDLAQGTLQDFIKKQEQINPNLINKMIKNLLNGLKQLYFQHMIHRDIKPSNILYYEDQNTFKFGDFGTCKINNDVDKTITIRGSPEYFSPELYKLFKEKKLNMKKEESDLINWYANDIFSTGLSFFAAVCIVENMSLYVQNPDLIEEKLKIIENQHIYDPLVFQIIRNMLILDQDERFQIDDLIVLSNKLS